MLSSIISCLLFAAALPLCAQVKITQHTDRISVDIDGKPFTEMFVGADVPKPYLYPLRAASGKIVTRAGFPEGTKLVVQVDEPEEIELDAEDEAAIERALGSVRAGKGSRCRSFAQSCSGSNIVEPWRAG